MNAHRSSTIVRAEEVAFQPFSLPGFTGGTSAAFLNTDVATAPFVALLRLEPGAVLAKHYHPKAIEAVYVLDGEMINDGVPLAKGSMVSHGPGVAHGPHTTETGCTLMFIQYPGVGPDDSIFVD
jgi:quercetin dioxygenase-like cupin family protein